MTSKLIMSAFIVSCLLVTFGCAGRPQNSGNNQLTSGGITSGGLPKTCPLNALIGNTYRRSGLEIKFIEGNQATILIDGENQSTVEYVPAPKICKVSFKDGRAFWVAKDLSKITDTANSATVLRQVDNQRTCRGQDADASLVGKTFKNRTNVTLRFLNEVQVSFDDGRPLQNYSVSGAKLILHIRDGEFHDESALTIKFIANTVTIVSTDPVEGSYVRINCD